MLLALSELDSSLESYCPGYVVANLLFVSSFLGSSNFLEDFFVFALEPELVSYFLLGLLNFDSPVYLLLAPKDGKFF